MTRFALLACLLALSGCGTLDGKLDNRMSCTLARDAALYSSMYGRIGFTSYVNDEDGKAACARRP